MIHNVDVHKTENVPLVVVNFSSDEIYLSKGETVGFMQNQALDDFINFLYKQIFELEKIDR